MPETTQQIQNELKAKLANGSVTEVDLVKAISDDKIVMELSTLGSLCSVIKMGQPKDSVSPIASLWTDRGECKIALKVAPY